MRHGLRGGLIAALIVAGAAGTAQANVTFSVSGVQVTTGGNLAGSFTTNDARTSVVSFDITVPSSATFDRFEYSSLDATVTAASLPSQYFRLDTAGNTQELQLYFTSGLSSTGGTLSSSASYENQPSGGNRFLSGAVTVAQAPISSVPEPASLLLIAGGVASCLGLRRGRVGANA